MQSHCKRLVLRVFLSSFANPLLYLISLFSVFFVCVASYVYPCMPTANWACKDYITYMSGYITYMSGYITYIRIYNIYPDI